MALYTQPINFIQGIQGSTGLVKVASEVFENSMPTITKVNNALRSQRALKAAGLSVGPQFEPGQIMNSLQQMLKNRKYTTLGEW